MLSSTLEWLSSLCLLGVDTHEPIAFHCKIAHFSLPREINSKPVFGERFTRLRLGGVVKKQFPQEWQALHAECLRSTLIKDNDPQKLDRSPPKADMPCYALCCRRDC